MSSRPLDLEILNSSWGRITLENACVFIKDGTHGTHIRVNSGIPLLSAKNISTAGTVNWDSEDSLISQEDYSKIHAKYELEQDDLLLTVVGTLGRRALVSKGEKYTIQRSVAALRLNQSIVLPKFLFQFVASDYFQRQLALRSNATAQAGVYLGELARIQIPVPPVQEQQKIASILTAVDEVIESTQAQINKLKDLKTGMMQELLTKGIGQDGQPHTKFKDSPVGRIPGIWKVKTLSEVCVAKYGIVDGPFGSNLKTEHYRENGIPVFQSGFVTSNKFVEKEYVFVDHEKYQEQIRSSAGPGDILMAKIGMNAGACAIIPLDHQVGILAGNSLKMTINDEIASNYYVLNVLHHMQNTGEIRQILTETAQPAISISTLKKMKIAIPPRLEQSDIVRALNSLDTRISTEVHRQNSLGILKKALMQDLLTGKVRVQ